MTFQEPLRAAETAQAKLARAQATTAGWAGGERHAFDTHRIKPLSEAAVMLITALKHAEDQSAAVARLLAD